MKLKDAEVKFKIAQENLQNQKDKLVDMMSPIKTKFGINSVTELEVAETNLKKDIIKYINEIEGNEEEKVNKEEFEGL